MAWIKVKDENGEIHTVTESSFEELYKRHGFVKVETKIEPKKAEQPAPNKKVTVKQQ